MKRILLILFVLYAHYCFSQSGATWRLIESKAGYESEDLAVAAFTDASLASIDKTGERDSRDGIQELLTRIGDAGGGVLYLSAGKYKIGSQLLIPKGVILRGDWRNPSDGQPVTGTVLMAYFGRGSEDEANSFITMESSTGLYNISIWYPEQDADNITPYPPTILYGRYQYWGNDYCNVRNVTLFNSYSGVILSRRNGGGCPNVFNLYGTPLSRGIEIDNIADVGRLDWIRFSPDFWAESGLPGAPVKGSAYGDRIRREATGIVMRRNDWSYTCHVFIEGYNIGFHAAESIASPGAQPNGHNYGMTYRNCGTAVYIESISGAGIMFTRVKIDDCRQGIVVAEGTASTAQFYDCEISASSDAIKVLDGATTKVMTQQCRILSGQVNIGGGIYSSIDGDFDNPAPQVIIGPYARTILSGNRFAAAADIKNNSMFESKIDHNPVTVKKLPEFPEIRPHETKPPREALYVVTDTEFGATGNATTDNTAAIQNALNKAGSEGGGIVFLPPGKYKVTGNLTVPSNVELKGAADLASVPKGQGSIIEIYAGKNNPSGAPFLKLSGKSGIRGITFNYPEQLSTYTKNIATLPKYPYCIQATGSDVYIVNVGVRATDNGIDLFTYRCDNHYVDYFAGHVFRNGIRVGGGSENGLISNVQFNSLVFSVGYENPKFGNWPNSIDEQDAKNGVYDQNWLELEFMILEDCEDEMLYNDFHYASRRGLLLRRNNGKAPSGMSLGLGIDASMHAICFEALSPEKGFDMINSQVVSITPERLQSLETKFIETSAGFSGVANLFSSDYWGGAKYGGVFNGSGGGKINFTLANFEQYGATRYLDIRGNDEITVSNSFCNASNFVASGKNGQVAVESSVSALSSPTGYKNWFNNLTTGPVFSPGSTLPRTSWIATAIGGNPGQAIDGLPYTRWDNGSQVSPGQWFAVNTRVPVRINTVILDASGSPNDYPKEYAVYVSSDGVNWGQPIATGSKPSALLIISIPETTTQYLKIVQTGRGKTEYWSIHEFYLAYIDYSAVSNPTVDTENAPTVYPNPVSDGTIHIKNADGVRSVKIYSLDGRMVGDYPVRGNPQVSIRLRTSDKGIFIVVVESLKGISMQKIIVL
ncbi:MAG: discoidin domain-containing protein [Tannerella sp.]|jgi:hypothetical protein|nr:discoidin domain-containing protein [Tannerella sp.]